MILKNTDNLEQNRFWDRVINKENNREKDSEFIPASYGLGSLVRLGMVYAEYNGAKDYFYANSKCTGCGTCEKICLSGKIKMINNKPV